MQSSQLCATEPTAWELDTTVPEKETGSALDVQEGGDHYKKMGLYQPWIVAAHQLTAEELKGAMKFTVTSYLAREADKGGRLDIKKSLHTLQIYLELTENAEET